MRRKHDDSCRGRIAMASIFGTCREMFRSTAAHRHSAPFGQQKSARSIFGQARCQVDQLASAPAASVVDGTDQVLGQGVYP